MTTPLLVGNSFALLVAAHALARQGRPVVLMTDGKPLGGHFAGMRIEGQGFDMGMVLLEKCLPAQGGQRLGSYDPAVRNDWTRFGDLAGQWLEAHADLCQVPTPECQVAGRTGPDYLIANRLDLFAGSDALPPVPLARSDERHAAHKTRAAAYDHMSYAEAALHNHGAAVQARFIEPFVRKLLGVSSSYFLARYHRAAWAPLFYPETLASALQGQPTGLPEYPFWTTRSGFVGQLVQDLRDGLAASPQVTLVTSALQSLRREGGVWTATAEGLAPSASTQLALGLAPDRAALLLGTAAQQPGVFSAVTLLFARVRADAIGQAHACLMVVDEAFAAYRLCDQDRLAGQQAEWHRVVIEANPEQLARRHPGLSPEVALAQELRALLAVRAEGAVQVLKCLTAKSALLLPTAEVVASAEVAHAAWVAAAPGAALTANLLGYGVASLNDQLVQGLKIAEEFT